MLAMSAAAKASPQPDRLQKLSVREGEVAGGVHGLVPERQEPRKVAMRSAPIPIL